MNLFDLRFTPYRWVLLLHVALLPIVGYALRFSPALPEWLRNLSGSIAYEMLWIFAVLAIWPRLKPLWVATAVCLATFGVEFLQLVQHPVLVAARATLPGRLILGSGFTWADFPLYMLGSGCGWLWATGLKRRLRHG